MRACQTIPTVHLHMRTYAIGGCCLCVYGACFGIHCALLPILSLCRDEGRLEEVVELLTDICKYYSGQGWVEISEGVYTTLAASLKELGRQEEYVHVVAVLVNLYSWEPDPPDAEKKVAPWMEELKRLSQLPREGAVDGAVCVWEWVCPGMCVVQVMCRWAWQYLV